MSQARADLFIRPENIELLANDQDGTLAGHVVDKLFKGPHEVLVIKNRQETAQILLETEHSAFTPGDQIYLRPKTDKFLELTQKQ